MYSFSQKSIAKLQAVHPDLIKVMQEAISNAPYDFSITEGVRSLERQKELFAARKSTTMRSRHLTGHAVDIAVFVDGKVTWDLKYYKEVTDHIKVVAKLNDVPLEFGIDWKSFVDAPHVQLPWKQYP
jgi:peptidoglycan L-alanyl-D-glutamate endopeptidase CwlK